jgi:hypothetical protein
LYRHVANCGVKTVNIGTQVVERRMNVRAEIVKRDSKICFNPEDATVQSRYGTIEIRAKVVDGCTDVVKIIVSG